MKDMKDINARIRSELNQWFPKQCHNEYLDFYWYYLETNQEHDGNIIILEDNDSEYNQEYQLLEKVRKDLTVDQNFYHMSGLCRRLPILELERGTK